MHDLMCSDLSLYDWTDREFSESSVYVNLVKNPERYTGNWTFPLHLILVVDVFIAVDRLFGTRGSTCVASHRYYSNCGDSLWLVPTSQHHLFSGQENCFGDGTTADVLSNNNDACLEKRTFYRFEECSSASLYVVFCLIFFLFYLTD